MMPRRNRKHDLPALSLSSLPHPPSQDVHTPFPTTPMPFEQDLLAMGAGTPTFEISSVDAMRSGTKRPLDYDSDSIDPAEVDDWTENEDGLLQGFLVHPPRPLQVSFPPSALPPPAALDEITSQIIVTQFSNKSRTSPSPPSGSPPKRTWRHSWRATRLRLFQIARAESMTAIGGHRRQKSDSLITFQGKAPTGTRIIRHHNDSMDSLLGDEPPRRLSETLRLSNTLQSTAKDEGATLCSNSGLESPLNANFPSKFPSIRRPSSPFSTSAPMASASLAVQSRPVSLLQRGRSFTFADFNRLDSISPFHDDPSEEDYSSSSSFMSKTDIMRSLSPSAPNFLHSLELSSGLGSECSTATNLTLNIPPSPEFLPPSTASPASAFATLSISNLPESTSMQSDSSSPRTSSYKRFRRPIPLLRSLSDGVPLSEIQRFSSLSSPRENKRQRAELPFPTPESVAAVGQGHATLGAGRISRPGLDGVGLSPAFGLGIQDGATGIHPPFQSK